MTLWAEFVTKAWDTFQLTWRSIFSLYISFKWGLFYCCVFDMHISSMILTKINSIANTKILITKAETANLFPDLSHHCHVFFVIILLIKGHPLLSWVFRNLYHIYFAISTLSLICSLERNLSLFNEWVYLLPWSFMNMTSEQIFIILLSTASALIEASYKVFNISMQVLQLICHNILIATMPFIGACTCCMWKTMMHDFKNHQDWMIRSVL